MQTSYVVVSSFGKDGYALYGRTFLQSFSAYWPSAVRLVVYVDEMLSDFPKDPRIEYRLFSEVPAFAQFELQHKNNAAARGLVPTRAWKDKCKQAGYNFRFDAAKFCKKVFAIAACMRRFSKEHVKLIWLDADVVTHKAVPMTLLEWILPEGKHISYLDRGGYHSECGVVGYDLRCPEVVKFIEQFEELFTSGEVFSLSEWHDSFVFDQLRGRVRDAVVFYKMPHHGTNQPFNRSELRNFLVHLKGDLKVHYADSSKLGIAGL